MSGDISIDGCGFQYDKIHRHGEDPCDSVHHCFPNEQGLRLPNHPWVKGLFKTQNLPVDLRDRGQKSTGTGFQFHTHHKQLQVPWWCRTERHCSPMSQRLFNIPPFPLTFACSHNRPQQIGIQSREEHPANVHHQTLSTLEKKPNSNPLLMNLFSLWKMYFLFIKMIRMLP
jgi:hypothetical protein